MFVTGSCEPTRSLQVQGGRLVEVFVSKVARTRHSHHPRRFHGSLSSAELTLCLRLPPPRPPTPTHFARNYINT